jgi:hypothetical protein
MLRRRFRSRKARESRNARGAQSNTRGTTDAAHLWNLEAPMKPLTQTVCSLSLLALAPTPLWANVLVVDASGGSQFLQIQAAVDAALDGDTLLVKRGTYASFAIVNKSLDIVGDANAVVTVMGGAEVRSLAAGRAVVLANLVVHGQSSASDWHANGLYLKNDAGSVRVQRCTSSGGSSASFSTLCAGADVEACLDVAFVGCSLHGGTFNSVYVTPSGLVATGSMIAVYDCQVAGSDGSLDCFDVSVGSGGIGALVTGSFVFASGTQFIGGNGAEGDGYPCPPQNGGNGGVAISLLASATAASQAELLDTQLAGGHGGMGSCGIGCGNDGHDGAPSSVGTGCVLDLISGSKRVLSAPNVVRELASYTLTFQGQPGDQVGVFFAPRTSFDYISALRGVKMVATDHPPMLAAWLGIADATGSLSVQYSFPDLGPGVQSTEYYLQAIVQTASGTKLLGSPASLTVLDSSF